LSAKGAAPLVGGCVSGEITFCDCIMFGEEVFG
jgi:hypothetical protein